MIAQKLYLVRIDSNASPDINYGYSSYGLIGKETKIYDINGEMICVGDIIKITDVDGSWWSNIVIEYQLNQQLTYFTTSGMVSKDLKNIVSKRKIERVIPYKFFNEEFRRFIHYIALSETYLDTCWDFIDGVWTKIK